MGWDISKMPRQDGRRIVISGANSGIGFSAAIELARQGAVVILACRDKSRGQNSLEELHRQVPGARAELAQLDLASLESIREFANAELARGEALDCLINNAGVMAPPKRRETMDAMELQFGTNVVGHFCLTGLLLPALELATAARVVTVASIAHKRGQLHFDDLQSRNLYSPMGAYQQSKLGDLMFALEMERRLRAVNSKVTSIAVHPGVAKTELFKVGSSQGVMRVAEKALAGMIGALLNSQEDGAVPTLYAATAPEAQGGRYYGPQGFQEMRGGDVGEAKISAAALKVEDQRRLWQVCEELSGVSFLD